MSCFAAQRDLAPAFSLAQAMLMTLKDREQRDSGGDSGAFDRQGLARCPMRIEADPARGQRLLAFLGCAINDKCRQASFGPSRKWGETSNL